MELLSLAVLAIGGWLIWKFGRDKPKPKPKATSEPTVQQDVEYLRRMAGITEKTAYTSPTPPRQPPTMWVEPAPVKAGLKYLRQLCREARLDEEITEGEARKLLHAFAVFESDQPKPHTHAHYVLELLRECLADGKLNKNEAQELLTAVGEFADSAPPLPVMPLGDIRPTWDTPEPPPVKKERQRKAAAATPLRNVSLTPGQDYELTYKDSTGTVSERVIQLKGLSGTGRTKYLEAYCTKAHGYRTFRVDRVVSLVDLSTGEVMIDA